MLQTSDGWQYYYFLTRVYLHPRNKFVILEERIIKVVGGSMYSIDSIEEGILPIE